MSNEKQWLNLCAKRLVAMDLEALPKNAELEKMYTLSDKFREDMAALSKKTERRLSRRNIIRYTATAAALLILLFNLLQPQYITKAGREIIQWFQTHAIFRFREDAGVLLFHGCEVAYLPEGYALLEDWSDEYGGMLVFSNGLVLSYGPSDGASYVNNENVNYYVTATADGIVLHCFQSTDSRHDNIILWTDKTGRISFSLSGSLPIEELFRIQAGVSLNEVTILQAPK